MFPKAIRRMAPVCLSVAFLLGGCTYPSDVKELKANTSTAPTDIGTPAGPLAVERLKKAIEKAETDPNAQKFWYTGYVKNTILSRTTTSMFDGIVSKPEGYLVNARIAAQPYQYYRYHDKTYLRNGDYWITAQEQPLSFDVWKGFDDWLPFLTNAVQLPSEKIMGVDTTPFQIKISGAQWLAGSNSDLFGDLKKEIADRPDMQELLKQSTIKTHHLGQQRRQHRQRKRRFRPDFQISDVDHHPAPRCRIHGPGSELHFLQIQRSGHQAPRHQRSGEVFALLMRSKQTRSAHSASRQKISGGSFSLH
ncbi:UNVERIFIED_CONTAM: hypothetical protein ABID98_003224 [Brevibacillus sp. OAP136]